MRNLKSIITIIAISLSTVFSTSASEKNPSKTTKELRTEIVSMLGKKIPIEFTKAEKVEVSFMINKQNELVVLSVDCNQTEFNTYVKNKLNYKKLNAVGAKQGEVYKVPVTLKIK
jgi:septum formation topological specificity factor MinE